MPEPTRLDIISPDMMLEAIAYAREHKAPLLRRLCDPRDDDVVVLALWWNAGDVFRFSAEDVEAGTITRRQHLEWLRERLDEGNDGDFITELERALGDAYVETLRDQVQRTSGAALDARTFAKVYGGPAEGTDLQLHEWLSETVAFDEVAYTDDFELRDQYLRGMSQAYLAMEGAVRACEPYMPWLDPDSGEDVGWIGLIDSMMADSTLEVSSPVALTCFQWTCDLMGLGIRVVARQY